jgi:hypothetical protein
MEKVSTCLEIKQDNTLENLASLPANIYDQF